MSQANEYIKLLKEWSALNEGLFIDSQEVSLSLGGESITTYVFAMTPDIRLRLYENLEPNASEIGWILQLIIDATQNYNCSWTTTNDDCQIHGGEHISFQRRTGKPILAMLAAWVNWLKLKKGIIKVL
ncbi:MAG: hypothetical protein KME29_05095 [Calothrix sp. FI2-JRJ7]|jgi:hypothetical protein|nr:hypothetical protein [Calothrix sp. FI2-JRJ7]